MIAAPMPADESTRLSALQGLWVLYTPAEERFDRITRLARQLLDVPIALVSLVDAQCQWFKSSQGMPVSETARTISFCAHAILMDDTMLVPDTLLDPRFLDSPLVTGEPYVRFYAGHPLRAADSSKLGTFCIMDRRPRQMSGADLEKLRDLAAWAENELKVTALSKAQIALISECDDLRRKAMIDSLTRLWNRSAIMDVLHRELARVQRNEGPVSVIMADVDHFKNINDTYGHMAGDAVLVEVVKRMRSSVRPYDAIGRYGGEEFLLVLGNCDPETGLNIAERARTRVAGDQIETSDGRISATISLGLTSITGETDADKLIHSADMALYRAKGGGRNRVEVGAVS